MSVTIEKSTEATIADLKTQYDTMRERFEHLGEVVLRALPTAANDSVVRQSRIFLADHYCDLLKLLFKQSDESWGLINLSRLVLNENRHDGSNQFVVPIAKKVDEKVRRLGFAPEAAALCLLFKIANDVEMISGVLGQAEEYMGIEQGTAAAVTAPAAELKER